MKKIKHLLTVFFLVALSAASVAQIEQIPLPPQVTGFCGATRGFWIIAPVDFTIIEVRVPTTFNAGPQSIAIVTFDGNVPPPAFPGTTLAYNTEFYVSGDPSAMGIPVNIPITAGQVLGSYGSRNGCNSYGPTGPFNTTLFGNPITLTRSGMQTNIEFTYPFPIWTEAAFNVSRVEVTCQLGGGGGGAQDCLNDPCVTVVCPPDVTVQCIEDFTPDAMDATATSVCIGDMPPPVSNCVNGMFQDMDEQEITQTGQNFNFSFTGVPAPQSAATLTYCVSGDFGSASEFADLFDENNNLLTTNSGAGGDCFVAGNCQVLIIPQATVAGWAADGTIGFLSDNSAAVNSFCATEFNSIEISYACTPPPPPAGTNAIVGQWVTQPHQTGGPNCDGTTYVFTYKAVDSFGNIGCCEQVVTIANNPPTISVIPGGTVECAADIETDPSDATVTTSCGEELDVTIYAPVITGTANCPNTTYAYTYRVEDQCEREATATRTFTVQNTAPTLVAPANTTCECLGGITPNGANAAVDASCDLGYDVAVSGPIASGPQDCPGTTYTYTYTATDDCGRNAAGNQTFTISNGPPVFLNAPANCLILNCEDQGWQDIIQAWLANVKATNSCGLPLTVLNNYNPNSQGVCISNGTTLVTWRATDNCGRQSTAQSMIIINDTEPPVFTTPAQDELDICNYNTPAEFAAWVAARGNSVAVDGCDQNITSNQWSTIPNNPQFPNCMNAMGATSMSVTFVVRDDCGNKSSSTATFTALMAGQDMVEQGDGIVDAANEFELYQNQPNPFSNETLIGFSLPKAGTATLTIYDISGKVVKLVQGDYSEGYNEVQITRSELSSAGMLYYELNTADHTAVKKMIIID